MTMLDKRGECGCHRGCTTLPHQCDKPCRWPSCLTEAESAELVAECDAEWRSELGPAQPAPGEAEEVIRRLRTEVAELEASASGARCGGCVDGVRAAAGVLGWDQEMIRAMAKEFAELRPIAITRVRELEAVLDRTHAILRDLVAMKETFGHYDFAGLDGLVARARAEDVARDEAEGGSRGGEPDARS